MRFAPETSERFFLAGWVSRARFTLAGLVAILLTTASVRAAEPAGDEVRFARDVRPILAEHCFPCHGPDEKQRKARLRLDTAAGLAADLDGFRVTVPGDAEDSELFLRMTAEDDFDRMPPPDHGPGLTEDEIGVVRAWIEAGARFESHWAYAPFRDVAVPSVEDEAFVRGPIDRFVLARLEREGVSPSPEAKRRTLARRLSLDLLGMIPTPEEVEAFVADEEPDAYERLVDRWLASPHYAERWARHWLDLARYADSHGFTIDGGRSIWPYRDWVIDAIHDDMPYDRFTIEQLAGDLLDDPTNAQLVATGFHRNTQINQEGGAKDEENRVNAVLDRVNTTGAVWLGSTLECAQCHTHKYDPVSHREYYGMLAFYNSTEDGGVSAEPTVLVASNEEEAALVRRYESETQRLEDELARAGAAARDGFVTFRPTRMTGSNGPELRLTESGAILSIGHNPQTSTYVLEGSIETSDPIREIRLEALPRSGLRKRGPGRSGSGNFVLREIRLFVADRGPGDEVDWREPRIVSASADFSQETYPVESAIPGREGKGWAIHPRSGEPHAAVFALAEPLAAGRHDVRLTLRQDHGGNHVLGHFRVGLGAASGASPKLVPDAWKDAWAAVFANGAKRPGLPTTLVLRERREPRVTRVFERGSFLDPGEVVAPGYPDAMNHFAREDRPRTRLDLARWLVDPRNALAHRVTVNRWWQRFFGLGLVETENDFGIRGAAPSHPDLLEWLAQELVRSGFSMKAIHREIVTSATYRQSSRPRADLDERDPRDRWLARYPSRRADAEAIRDSALRASGRLSTKVGGPPVQPPQPDGVFAFTQSRKGWKASEGEDRFRRSIYTRLWRSSTYPFHVTFDAPVANVTCTRRGRSNTPLQALTMANDPMILELARDLAARVIQETPGASDGERIARAFLLTLGRAPVPQEVELVAAHLVRSRGAAAATAETEDADASRELDAWTAVGRVLLNTEEFSAQE